MVSTKRAVAARIAYQLERENVKERKQQTKPKNQRQYTEPKHNNYNKPATNGKNNQNTIQ